MLSRKGTDLQQCDGIRQRTHVESPANVTHVRSFANVSYRIREC
jgi:hypothetical protein